MATKYAHQSSQKSHPKLRRRRLAGMTATLVGLVGLVGTLLIPAAAAETTTSSSATFATVAAGVPQEVTVDQCNPANGVLAQVDISVTGDTSISYQAENESPGDFFGPEIINADLVVRLTLAGEGLAPPLQVTDQLLDTGRELGAPYDGTTDFGGTSGYTSPVQAGSGTEMVTLTGAALAPFVGTGTIPYTLIATSTTTISDTNYGAVNRVPMPVVEGGLVVLSCTFLTPSIDIEKSTNGDDADDTAGPELALGDTVTWTYLVTNDGDLPLTDVAVVDDVEGPVTCPATTLDVGAIMTCTLEGVAAVGDYENNARVDAQGPNGEPVNDEDPSHYNVPPNPAIDIEKDTNGDDADDTAGPELALGDAVTWTYVVTNTGNVDLVDVAVVDDIEGGVTCPQDTLAVGANMTCTADGTAASVGQYENNATVTGTGTDPDATPVTDADPSHYNVPARPAIDIEKDTNGDDADDTAGPTLALGDAVTWTYVVTNTGNVDLVDVAVVDDVEGAVTCPQATLAIDEMMTCTLQGVAAVGDYENGSTVTGVGTDPDATPVDDADPSHYNVPAEPSIDIEKDTNGDDADDTAGPTLTEGSTVTWTYVVMNTGTVDLVDVAVVDDVEGAVTCPETALAVGASMTCTLEGVAELGDYENNASVTGIGTDPGATPVDDADPSHYNGVPAGTPAIDIEKSTNGADADDAGTGPVLVEGGLVTWTYLVTNTGDVDLVNVAVVDDQEGAVECPETALAVGESMTCTKSGIAALGAYENNASVTGETPDGRPVDDEDPSHYTGEPPAPVAVPTAPPAPTPTPQIVPMPQPVPPPVPVIILPAPAPAPPVVKKVDPPKKAPAPAKKTELALTGTQSTAMSLLAAAIMGAGMITLGVSYRREDEAF